MSACAESADTVLGYCKYSIESDETDAARMLMMMRADGPTTAPPPSTYGRTKRFLHPGSRTQNLESVDQFPNSSFKGKLISHTNIKTIS